MSHNNGSKAEDAQNNNQNGSGSENPADNGEGGFFSFADEIDEATDVARKEILTAVQEGERSIDDAAKELEGTVNSTVENASSVAYDGDGSAEGTTSVNPEIPLDDAFTAIYNQLEAQGMDVDEMVAQNLMEPIEDILHGARKNLRYNQQQRK